MVTREVTVKSTTGLHARPATLFMKKAASFKSDIQVEYNGKKATGKSLIGILSLGIGSGSVIKIITSGTDEKAAADELAQLVESIAE
ncbi:MAG: HPr family phosphocarrier protein [Bacillota bacterium]|nr:HPr family phosphocarrier protein [Bacillota bacterium]